MSNVVRAGPGVLVALDPRLDERVAVSRDFDAALAAVADEAATFARGLARLVAFDSGAYDRSIHAELDYDDHGRRVGRLIADDWKGHLIERGFRHYSHGRPTGGRVPGKHVLERGWRRTGLPLQAS
jgi:hypothetical protein